MMNIFKSKETLTAKELTTINAIKRRAKTNTMTRRDGGVRLTPTTDANKVILAKLDKIMDSVKNYDNIKISTIAELYNAIESGDTKNLIEFLKIGDRPKIVRKLNVTVSHK